MGGEKHGAPQPGFKSQPTLWTQTRLSSLLASIFSSVKWRWCNKYYKTVGRVKEDHVCTAKCTVRSRLRH